MSEENEDPKPLPLAVALEYEIGTRTAPTVVAKGRGHIAEQIMEIARENGIMIEANPLLAEALSGVPLDDSIPHELYQAVAEVIGFVIRSRTRTANNPNTSR
jgi:flagellar biosynthesis protein